MTFSRRITLFLIGLFFGTVIVYTTFGDSDRLRFNWLPNSRVVNRIVDNFDTTNTKNQCFSACINLSQHELIERIKESEVDFEKSKAQDTPPSYYLQLANTDTELIVELREKAAVIQAVNTVSNTTSCTCQ